jgi:hypothetical protein
MATAQRALCITLDGSINVELLSSNLHNGNWDVGLDYDPAAFPGLDFQLPEHSHTLRVYEDLTKCIVICARDVGEDQAIASVRTFLGPYLQRVLPYGDDD